MAESDGGSARRRSWVLECGRRYWSRSEDALLALPVPVVERPSRGRFTMVALPSWASDLAAGGGLLVDETCVAPGEGAPDERCDWWRAAFFYLSGSAERRVEAKRGPIHSYSLGLGELDRRVFDRAWVNRILLFLRSRAARHAGRDEVELFGPLPEATFDLTHDVDAIAKTPGVRFKQTVVHAVNALRLAWRGRFADALSRLRAAGRFVTAAGDYWRVPEICALERSHGVRSTFHVAGATGTRRRRLLDPDYDVAREPAREAFRELAGDGWTIGLHPSFDAWRDAERIAREREYLEAALGRPVTRARQHHLRFSWADTWKAQQTAGLTLDATLGFNDRPGFRSSAALQYHPWASGGPLAIEALPLVLMDSQLYDYQPMTDAARGEAMARWVEEVKAVRGQASVVWHQRVMHPDYGWGSGYRALLRLIA